MQEQEPKLITAKDIDTSPEALDAAFEELAKESLQAHRERVKRFNLPLHQRIADQHHRCTC